MMAQTLLTQARAPVRSATASFAGKRISQKALVGKPAQRFTVRAEATEQNVDVEEVVKDLQAKWDGVENKPAFVIYSVAAFSGVWLASTVLPKVFELIGLGYSAWFAYRYLLFKSSREELVEDIESLKKKISGEN